MIWQSKNEVIIGEIGERIVKDILVEQGYILYNPSDLEKSHPFDFLAVGDGGEMMIVEVKTKRCREEYPDSGINTKNYWEYKEISQNYNLPVFIYFVDYHLEKVYGNYLDILEKNITIYPNGRELDYPRNEGGITYFPLDSMISIKYLDNKEIKKILEYID